MVSPQHKHLLALIRYALGGEPDSCLTDGSINWHAVYDQAKKQAIAGIAYAGVERLCELDSTPPGQWVVRNEGNGKALQVDHRGHVSQKPPLPLLLNWIGDARENEKRNKELDAESAHLCATIREAGFPNCIIKGQGVAALYNGESAYQQLANRRIPNLGSLRTPGDIDIWLDGSREDITRYVKSQVGDKDIDICQKHIEMPVSDTVIEVHFTPSTLSSPIANRRLQRFFSKQVSACCHNEITTASGNTFTAATVEFNTVQVLLHILGHFLYEGIGLRQVIDYFFVLKALKEKQDADSSASGSQSQEILALLHSLGLKNFCEALMYVLHNILGLPKEYLIAPVNERYGEILLSEILEGGNFGKSSALVNNKNYGNPLWRFVQHTKRELRFLRIVPSEILWSPYRRLATYLWRFSKGYIK